MNYEVMWCTLRKTLTDHLIDGGEVDLETILMLMDFAEILEFNDVDFCMTWLDNRLSVNKREFCE